MKIYSIERDQNGVVTSLGWSYEKSDNVNEELSYRKTTKEEFISECKSRNLESNIRTTRNENTSIISNKYLRTDGDESDSNDLLDLDSCDIFESKYESVLWKYKS